MLPRISGMAGLALCASLAGCGLPSPPDIRKQFSEKIEALGVTAVYPLQERIRLGQIWMVDPSASASNSGLKPRMPTGILVSDDLSTSMEAKRTAAATAAGHRFPSTGHSMDGVLGANTNTHFVPPANDTLELVGIPKYSLASVDQGSLAAVLPTTFARFMAALGLSRSVNLTVEAVGIEMATLPLDVMATAVRERCLSHIGVFGDTSLGQSVQIAAFNIMQTWAQERGGRFADFKPKLYLITKVFYLRGIRYVYNDTTVSSAMFTAAFDTRLGASNTPSLATTGPPSPDLTASADKAADLNTRIADLTKSISDLNAKLAGNNNINVAGSTARATAEGIEIVQLFERPLAFGYEPLAENVEIGTDEKLHYGIDELCRDFGIQR